VGSDAITLFFDQSYPSRNAWIIDNSEGCGNTDPHMNKHVALDSRLKYYRIGMNAGPGQVGAAKGLELCAA